MLKIKLFLKLPPLKVAVCLLVFVTLLSQLSIAQAHVILSGQIKAADTQHFYAPKTNSWRVQVQWIMPEGNVAKKGDLVVVFDSGTMQSQLEQEEASLISAKEELHRIQETKIQSLIEAEYAEKRSALLLKKARIDASVSIKHISKYDYEKNQLAFEKAIIENAKDQESLEQDKLAQKVATTKQKITINKHQRKLAYYQKKLAKMSLYAKRAGPVLYGTHPWTGEKIYVGITAQASWKIVEIPSLNKLYIEAWVHEVDYKHLTLTKKASLIFDAFPQQQLNATLTEISTQPEQKKEWGNDAYYKTKFTFATPKTLTLLPGMSAQLEFIGSDND